MPKKKQSSIESSNQYHAFVAGWRHGSSNRFLDTKFAEHLNNDIVLAYKTGHLTGIKMFYDAMKYAAKRYNYKPSILSTKKNAKDK